VAPQRDEIFKQKVNDCVQHYNFAEVHQFPYTIRSWSFHNICNEIGWLRFLRQPVLYTVTRSLTPDAARTTVQPFITCYLDYCNVILYGITDDLLRRLQSVQNAAASLVTGAGRSDHITPVLRQLHCLPVKRRIQFKLALLVYKSLHGSTPRYLSDDCQLVSDVVRRRLRSSDVSTCVVPRTQTGFGDRAFQVAGPKVWNSLLASLRQSHITVQET